MGKGKEIPISVRELIITHHKSGYGYKKIAGMVNLSKNTVATIVKKYKKLGTVQHQQGQGRKKKTTPRIDKAIIRKVLNNRRLSAPKIAAQLQNEFNVTVHPQTVRNRIKKEGFAGLVAVKKPWLSNKNIKLRLKWAKKHATWSIEDWKNVIWSDETKIQLFGSDGITRAWRKPGERMKKECLQPTVKHGGGKILCIVFLYNT